ncbi:MAG: acetylglutamate kinase [Candidatus Marinimicrobia bacterium]|nr:acetylglutamate kinase [Candidatus Neomarinimicrobiota bacterium]MCF7829487.1 acetylglutamate kinase [Candidatus Neomarinimicrobiota bacterium]MCF7880115.1 acetylglutamate kinase [Candidatus Neomarinimicrobiota bacterium]
MDRIIIAKIGGKVLNDKNLLGEFMEQFSRVSERKILVHGGGKVASDIAESMGVEVKMVDGRRITDRDTLNVVTMVYAGLLNKRVVAQLQGMGCNAAGFTGADANIILSERRPIKDIDYGYVGDVVNVNDKTLTALLSDGITPVIAPLTHDGKGTNLNTNADTMASVVAQAMAKHFRSELIYCFEMPGVLESVEDNDSVIRHLDYQRYEQLRTTGAIASGMIPKLDTGFGALDNGVSDVKICHANALASVIENDTTIRYTELQRQV